MNWRAIGNLIYLRYKLMWARTRSRAGRIALFFVGLLLIRQSSATGLNVIVGNPIFLYALIPLSSFLLVSEIPMFSFKFKGFGWVGNEIRFIFAAIAVVLLILMREAAISLLVVIYILMNIGSNLLKTNKS